jgi:hypothetical protein
MRLALRLIGILGLTFSLVSCGTKKDDTTDGTELTETAQQVGDIMASIDEIGGASGNIARLDTSIRNTFARYAPQELDEKKLAQLFLPEAIADSCSGAGFAACVGTTVTRTFGGCTLGSATFAGTVAITWAGTGVTSCTLNQTTNTISRSPSFTVEGRRGATLSVSKVGTFGSKLTWDSGTGITKVFSFTSDGIRRKFTSAVGSVFMDQTTTVTTPITVTGTLRSGRIMDGGALSVLNNITNTTCTFVPVNVTWPSGTGCNCPTQGTWQGTCTGGKTTSLVLNGCGTANYTEGTQTDPVTFDRCGT